MFLADESLTDGWQWPLQEDHEQTARDLWKASTDTKTHNVNWWIRSEIVGKSGTTNAGAF